MRLFQGRTIQRYILREFIVAFGLTLMACTLMMLLATLYQLANDYSDKGITVGRIALLSPFLLPKPLAYAIPLSTMIASTMVFSRMSAEDEVLAAQAGGAPLRVLVAPLIVASLLLSLFCLFNNQWAMAWSNSVIRNQVLKLDDPESFFRALNQPGTSLSLPTDNGSIICINLLPLATDPATKQVQRPIHIASFQNDQVSQTVLADDFTYKVLGKPGERVLSLTLKRAKKLGDSPAFFDEVTMEIPQPSLETLFSYGSSNGQRGWLDNYRDAQTMKQTYEKRHLFMLERASDFAASVIAGSPTDPPAPIAIGNAWSNSRISTEAIYAGGGAIDQEHSDIVEGIRKIALSLLPISMALLGAGLGLLVKKSQRMIGFLISLLVYALVYYPLMLVGKELAMAGKIGLFALWIPNVLLLLAGLALCVGFERGLWSGAPTILTDIWKTCSTSAKF